MASSMEDILVNVNNVKKNKCEGSLFLMTQRLAWMPAGKNNFTVSYNYSDIKLQKISPDTKEKVQLQVVLEAGGASTFHFNNPGGRAAQMKDRESIKSLLQEMINKFKKNVSSELELKSMILKENPSMFELYKLLVVSGKLTSDEFWASRNNEINPNKIPEQEIGVSSGFLGEIQGHADGCNGIKYNLTPDIISNIFKTYPAVDRKYKQLVPDRISEQQFWYEFFQSHYFHRDRTNISEKEVFADCVSTDERALRAETDRRAIDKSRDFGSLYRNMHDWDNLNEMDDNIPTSSLIKRINQHSHMVLNSTLTDDEGGDADNAAGAVDKNGGGGGGANNVNNNNSNNNNNIVNKDNGKTQNGNNNKNNERKRSNVQDMESSSASKRPKQGGNNTTTTTTTTNNDIYCADSDTPATKLKLSKTEAYLHGPIPQDSITYNTSDELYAAVETFKQSVRNWKPTPLNQIITSASAWRVLSELAPSGSLMQNSASSFNVPVLPADVQEELRLLARTLRELLSNFWTCFPLTDKSSETKAVRMIECLKEFETGQLNNFKDKLLENHLPVDIFTDLIKIRLGKAYTKFSAWKSRKSSSVKGASS